MVGVLNFQMIEKLIFNVDCSLVLMIRLDGYGKHKKNGIKKGVD